MCVCVNCDTIRTMWIPYIIKLKAYMHNGSTAHKHTLTCVCVCAHAHIYNAIRRHIEQAIVRQQQHWNATMLLVSFCVCVFLMCMFSFPAFVYEILSPLAMFLCSIIYHMHSKHSKKQWNRQPAQQPTQSQMYTYAHFYAACSDAYIVFPYWIYLVESQVKTVEKRFYADSKSSRVY